MDWRTELQVNPSKNKISLSDKIFTIGSCFSDEIGQLLLENKFTVNKNPFGTVYNPASIHELLNFGLTRSFPLEESYLQNDDVHFNYHFHSSFSSLNQNDLEKKIQTSIIESNSFLKNTSRIIITYGTAFVYKYKSTNTIVANCHKVPGVNFEKKLLGETEIKKSFEDFYSILKSVNHSVKIILTVSPVRHLKDTLELNAVSKSILRTACHLIVKQYSDVEYFPSYEILLDDLRDYRFYKTDRIHPTDEAVEYIWEKFKNAYFDEPTKKIISEWKKIKTDLAHKPFHPELESHQKFLKSLLIKIENLQTQIDVSKEMANLKAQILHESKN